MGRGRGGRRGGQGGGGYGRRDTRPGGGASRDDRDRRPDHRPRRTPSPDRRPRRSRGEDDDRDPPRGGRIGYGGGDRSPPRGGRSGYGGGDRSPPRGGRSGYGGGDCSPPRRERTGYRDRHASPRRGRVGYEEPRDPSGRGPNREYGGDRQSPRGRREYSPPGARAYGRGSYREERDRYDRPCRGRDHGYDEAPPAYMLPDHPSNLGRPSLRTGKKESDYFGGSGDRSHPKDDYLGGGPGPRSIGKESELFGDGGVTLRISASELGRTTAMYSQSRRSPPLRRSPPPRTVLSPPPLYPSVPPESGFLTGGSAMRASEGYGVGSTQLLHDDGNFKYHKHSHDHIERSRDIERHYSGSRDLVDEKGGGTERFYSAGDAPPGRVRDTERLYSSRDMLESDLVPRAQLKPLGDSSSALLAKDHPYRMHTEPVYEPSNGYIMNGLGRSSHDSLGHGSGHPHRLSGSPLEHGSANGDEALLDIARQAHSKHAPRSASMEYDGHDEYFRRDPINDGYAAPENLRVNASLNSRHISGTASLRGIRDERVHHLTASHRIEEFESSIEAMHQDTEQLNKRSYDGDASVHYPTRGGNDRYSHSPVTEPFGTAGRPAHHRDVSFENLSDQEASPMVSRKRYRSPAYLDHEIDVYQTDDGFAGYGRYDDGMDAYDSPPRLSIYDMVGDDEYDKRYEMPTNRNVFSRLALPDETNGEWTDMDQGSHARSDIMAYGRSKHMPMSQRLSKPNFHSQFLGTSMHGRGRGKGGLTKSAKKRLRTAAHQFHGGYPTEEHEFVKSNKFPKSSEDDPNGSEVKHEDAPEYEDLPVQKDPPEGSEEFSKQVHQAFLKYAKILNESPASQKKYRQASKGSLSCCVCGSAARKFPDVDALVSHAYDTCKAGLKTKHLGFHKALCVLMGWNWLVAPDTSRAHHSIPSEEVNALRGDLMLWPPVVVIHNSSIVNEAKDTEAKIVSMEEIEGVLADIGVPREKVKVSHGKPANQGIFLVKFQPTISGFQEAMRTNDHFSSRNHGKEELLQMIDGKGKKAAPIDTLEELLYAHIAVVEDLGYLDEEAKRRCKIRSKKEIEANADATMNLEP